MRFRSTQGLPGESPQLSSDLEDGELSDEREERSGDESEISSDQRDDAQWVRESKPFGSELSVHAPHLKFLKM